MNEGLVLPAAFLAGFFGSTHCLGMCGAIVVLFERSAGDGRWLRRLAYNGGRLGFYVLLGSVAGAGGAVLTRAAGIDAGLMILRLLAAVLVIAIGLNLLFDGARLRFLEHAGAKLWRRISPLARHVLPATNLPRALAAGFLWGALPCGLVYSAVALAATSGGLANGGLTMLAFWAGTLPALLAGGATAQGLAGLKSGRGLRQVAGLVMIVIGLAGIMPFVTLLRG